MSVGRAHDAQGRLTGLRWLIRDITERKRAEDEIRRSREQLSALASHLESIHEEERSRVSRDLLDEMAVGLVGLKMDLAWVAGRLRQDQHPLQEKVGRSLTLLDTTIQSMRRLVTELRPPVLDGLGLVAAIEWQAQEFQTRTGIECQFSCNLEDIAVDRESSTALFRTCQEALSDVACHAKPTRVSIHLERTPERLVLTVADNGRGITEAELADRLAFGLLGMRERARALGGSLTINGQPDGGTTVAVEVPSRRPDAPRQEQNPT